ncbi:MAG: ral nucleoside transport system permease protein [Chloroflexota bacterium]|nr:ral nucleoside transport system permease protein [Chloroflexota bacterium]
MELLFGALDVALLASTIRLVGPILLASLGGLTTERAGVFNVALEGLMLVGAFFAVAGTYWTGNPFLGVGLAVLAAVAVALIFAFVVVDLGGDQVVAGLAINILALGLTTYLVKPVFGTTGSFYDPKMPGLPEIQIPIVHDIPVLGTLLSGYSPLTYLAFAVALVGHVLLYRHHWGIRLRAVGESPVAAGSVGISVRRVRYLAIVASGVFCGLAGAELSISLVTQFVQGMTAGRGFIALVAVMFGRARPIPTLAACLLFGFAYALTLRLQGGSVPPQFVAMLPYVATIAVLVAVAVRARRRRTALLPVTEVVLEEGSIATP